MRRLLLLCLSFGLCAQEVPILLKMRTGDESAFELYRDHVKESGRHNFELLQKLGFMLLEKGAHSSDPEIRLLTLFGAGISSNEKSLPILEEMVLGDIPQLQLVALNFLARLQNDRADTLLLRGMSSPFLPIRLETAFLLAAKKDPRALGQVESLMCKVAPPALPIFPELFAMIGDKESTRLLRRQLNDSNPEVRCEAILSVARHKRDDLLPVIRTLASQHNSLQQEAAAVALGTFRDEASIPRLEALTRVNALYVQLAAWHALGKMGREKEALSRIQEVALAGDLFAITLLGTLEGSEETLVSLSQSNQINIRINASLALLERKDSRADLRELLVRDSRDLAFVKIYSPSGGIEAWKAIPSSLQNLEEKPVLHELSVTMREEIVWRAEDPLSAVEMIFNSRQPELVPVCVATLEKLRTKEAIALLKNSQQKIGAPLIRNYCTLSLYRLREQGPYEEMLRQFVRDQKDVELIRFRPFVPWEMRDHGIPYQLTPEETSRLLVEAVETLARSRDTQSIELLLDLIQCGNSKNKYALIGLLLQAVQ